MYSNYDFEIRNNTIERGSGLFMSIAITFFKTHFLSLKDLMR